ncbi:MAG: hypothetical protein AB8B83_03630 [Bdellovibrionales bacterium]
MNAVEHGNLGLGYDDKTEAINAGRYNDVVEGLQEKSDASAQTVEVQFIHKDGRYSVRITDQGDGFDWRSWVAFDSERNSFVHGYGVLKAVKCFDEVKYNTAGNQVMASIFET